MKDDFLNQIYLKSYLDAGALVLNGIITVEESDWKQANESVSLTEGRHEQLVRDIQSLSSSGILSDFTFVIDGRELEVHKSILAGE